MVIRNRKPPKVWVKEKKKSAGKLQIPLKFRFAHIPIIIFGVVLAVILFNRFDSISFFIMAFMIQYYCRYFINYLGLDYNPFVSFDSEVTYFLVIIGTYIYGVYTGIFLSLTGAFVQSLHRNFDGFNDAADVILTGIAVSFVIVNLNFSILLRIPYAMLTGKIVSALIDMFIVQRPDRYAKLFHDAVLVVMYFALFNLVDLAVF